MAFGGSATGTTTISLTSVTAGATICVFPTDTNGNATAFTVSDAQGTYSARGSIQKVSGDTGTQLLILTNANAGTHTISLSATGDTIVGGLAFWYTGVGDVDNSHNAIAGTHATVTTTANNGTSGSLTSTTNGCTIVGVAINLLTTAACTVGTSPFTFTTRANGSIASTNGYRLEDAAQATAGATNVAFQYASGSHATAVIGFALAPASSNVTLSLTGQAITSAKGTIAPEADYALTGQSVTSAEGAIAETVGYALTGQAVTSAEGTITAAWSGSASLTGQAITSTEGTIAPAVSYATSGRAITSTEGAVAPAPTYGLTGQAVTSTEGTIPPAVSYGLTGQGITSTEGSITATQGGNVTLALTGQTLASTEGNIGPEVDYGLAGQALTSTEGTITASQNADVTLALAGLSAVFAQGQITVSGQDQSAQAGRHHKRFRVMIEGRAVYFATKREAEASRERHKEEGVILPKPVRVKARQLAKLRKTVEVKSVVAHTPTIKPPQTLPRVSDESIRQALRDAQMREEEEIAIALLLA